MPMRKKFKSGGRAGTSPRFIMVGGFLGAGKTTMLLRRALALQRVGLITSDQAAGWWVRSWSGSRRCFWRSW